MEVHTADLFLEGRYGSDRNVYFAIGNVANYKKVAARGDTILSGLFHIEAPIIHPTTYRDTPEASKYFERIFSFSSSEALAEFGCGGVELTKYVIPEPYERIFDDLWAREDRKYLTMISQNKLPNLYIHELYTERLRALEYFSRTDSIDLYGIGWDKMPFRVGERRMPPQLVRLHRMVWERLPFTKNHPYAEIIEKVWRGAVASKHETMSGYTFALTYENMVLEGWLNEKIFDAFLVGTVPVFLGAPDVTDYIPAECFIDRRDFGDYAELDSYLRSLSPQAIDEYRENARDFIASERYLPFTPQAFAELLLTATLEDLGENG
jgi:hypothetical protein